MMSTSLLTASAVRLKMHGNKCANKHTERKEQLPADAGANRKKKAKEIT